MQILPIDLTSIVAIVMGISLVLIPVTGLTLRFALKPLIETLGGFFQFRGVEESVRILERRMELLEAQNESMEQSLSRIADAVEFERSLREPVRAKDRSLAPGDSTSGDASG